MCFGFFEKFTVKLFSPGSFLSLTVDQLLLWVGVAKERNSMRALLGIEIVSWEDGMLLSLKYGAQQLCVAGTVRCCQ